MRRGSRLSVALHALLHLAERPGPLTSEELARLLHTNPVVVRRTMAGLRDRRVVRSEKGHGGGWTLERGLEALTLGEVYEALGAPEVFAIGHRVPNPRCPLEKAVHRAIDAALGEAEARFLTLLRGVSLADLAEDAPRPGRRPEGENCDV